MTDTGIQGVPQTGWLCPSCGMVVLGASHIACENRTPQPVQPFEPVYRPQQPDYSDVFKRIDERLAQIGRDLHQIKQHIVPLR